MGKTGYCNSLDVSCWVDPACGNDFIKLNNTQIGYVERAWRRIWKCENVHLDNLNEQIICKGR